METKKEYEYKTIQMTVLDVFKKTIPKWTEETINKMTKDNWEFVEQSTVLLSYPLLTFRRIRK